MNHIITSEENARLQRCRSSVAWINSRSWLAGRKARSIVVIIIGEKDDCAEISGREGADDPDLTPFYVMGTGAVIGTVAIFLSEGSDHHNGDGSGSGNGNGNGGGWNGSGGPVSSP